AGSIWAGTYGQGVYSWRNGQWQQHERAARLASGFVHCLFVDSDDRLWIGFERHGGMVCREGDDFRYYDGGGLLQDRVESIAEQPRGTLWFGTRNNGLFRRHENVFQHFTANDG